MQIYELHLLGGQYKLRNHNIRARQRNIFGDNWLRLTEKSWWISTYIDSENFYQNYKITETMYDEYTKFCMKNGYREYREIENLVRDRKMIEIKSLKKF